MPETVKRQVQTAQLDSESNSYFKLKDLRRFVRDTTDLDGESSILALNLDRITEEYGPDKAYFSSLRAEHQITVDSSFDLQKSG